MPKIRFPVVGPDQDHYPGRARCPWCRKRKVFDPHSFAVLSGGADIRSGADARMAGYLDLTWHGAHDGGSGRHRDLYMTVPIVRESAAGQFELYLCSTRCL